MEVMPTMSMCSSTRNRKPHILDMVKIMKGPLPGACSCRDPEMKEKLLGRAQNPSYCVVTVSDRSREQVEEKD